MIFAHPSRTAGLARAEQRALEINTSPEAVEQRHRYSMNRQARRAYDRQEQA